MKTKFSVALIFIILWSTLASATTIFPDSRTATNEVELGVEGIARLCPTGMWDHWTLRDIVYDKVCNTVMFVIQLNSWNEKAAVRERLRGNLRSRHNLGSGLEGFLQYHKHEDQEKQLKV